MDEKSTHATLLAGFPVVIEIPVQWGDQDAFGHVNNTVYLRWLESGRIAYMTRIGVIDLYRADRPNPGLGHM